MRKDAGLPEGWEVKALGDIGKVSMCKRILRYQTSESGDIPFYKIGTFGQTADSYISKKIYDEYRANYSFPKKGDILLSASGTIGKRVIYDGQPAYFQDSNIVWIDNCEDTILNEYLYQLYGITKWKNTEGATISRLYNYILEKTMICFPPLGEQKAIVDVLSTWDEAIEITERLIKAKEKQYKWLSLHLLKEAENNPSTKWKPLGQILDYGQPTKYIVNSTNYVQDGETPVLTANQSFILGYTNEREGIFNEHPVIIFDDFTTDIKYVDFPFKVKSSAMKILSCKNKSYNTRYIYTAMGRLKFPLGGHKRYWIAEYQFVNIPVPPYAEQIRIAEILGDAQKEINLLKKIADRYRIQKRGLMQKLLTGKWRVKAKDQGGK